MSIRTDSGVCKYCGQVLLVSQLTRLDGPPAVDNYACPECASGVTRKGNTQ